jgi:hypothetical protein
MISSCFFKLDNFCQKFNNECKSGFNICNKHFHPLEFPWLLGVQIIKMEEFVIFEI